MGREKYTEANILVRALDFSTAAGFTNVVRCLNFTLFRQSSAATTVLRMALLGLAPAAKKNVPESQRLPEGVGITEERSSWE